jgi:hypothetical protein
MGGITIFSRDSYTQGVVVADLGAAARQIARDTTTLENYSVLAQLREEDGRYRRRPR